MQIELRIFTCQEDLALCYETEATSNLENGLNCNFADSNNVKI